MNGSRPLQILVIADDPEEQRALVQLVQEGGVTCCGVVGVAGALAMWEEYPANLILLALRQPRQADVAQLRTVTIAPLFVMIDDLTMEERALWMGQFNLLFIQRPYDPRLLQREITVWLRYSGGSPHCALVPLRLGMITLDPATHLVHIGDGSAQRLSRLEFALLQYLMQHPGQVLTYERLLQTVWGYDAGDKHILQNIVSRLRKKIELTPDRPRYLQTVRDVGYTLQG